MAYPGNVHTCIMFLRNIFFFPRQSLPRPYPPVSSLVWQSWRDGELACWIFGGKRLPSFQSIAWLDFWVTSRKLIARCPQPGPPASVSGHSLLLSATALCRQDSGLPICPFAGSSREPTVQETLFDLLAAISGSSSWHTWGQGQTPGSRQHFNSWGDSCQSRPLKELSISSAQIHVIPHIDSLWILNSVYNISKNLFFIIRHQIICNAAVGNQRVVLAICCTTA